ncbi:MAG TPA: citrate synthase [Blastocatellia bacterium]|nr:citrate synthase [Blastocatellia bacterium]
MATPANAGLEDVVAAPSGICYIDGDQGILSYRGYDIHQLAENSTFEEVIYLLWYGHLPKKGELADLDQKLKANRELPPEIIALMKSFPKSAKPMDVLRTAVSALGMYDPETSDNSIEANWRKSVRITAQLATIVAAFHRIRNGQEPLKSKPELNHAADFLWLLNGKEPMDVEARALDIALILHADHEFNASTFAARVTTATLTDLYSAITSAVGTLAGPLHGGANEAVMKMLLESQTVEGAEKFVSDALAAKQKIMGIGHRVYTTEDPRATHLRRMSEEIGRRQGDTKWFDMSKRIEDLVVDHFMKAGKKLRANVDFYSASTYYMLGITIDLFTPIFAVSRISGWTAHVMEQYTNNRLIRPRAEYTGELDLKYIPIEQR